MLRSIEPTFGDLGIRHFRNKRQRGRLENYDEEESHSIRLGRGVQVKGELYQSWYGAGLVRLRKSAGKKGRGKTECGASGGKERGKGKYH